MSTATFYHKFPPQVSGAQVTIRIHAESADPSAVLIDHEVVLIGGQPEGDSHTRDLGPGDTIEEKVLSATKAYVIDIASRRTPAITLGESDVSEVPAP